MALVGAFRPEERFFADLDIEILQQFGGHLRPHHRSPTSARKPAGQDLDAPSGADERQYRSKRGGWPVLFEQCCCSFLRNPQAAAWECWAAQGLH